MNRRGDTYGRAKGVLTLPDSLTAGRGEAMPWEKAETAEKGSGALSLSPKGSGRSRAEHSVMNSLSIPRPAAETRRGVNIPAGML